MEANRLPDPAPLGQELNELNGRYVQAVQQLLAAYPTYAADPTVAGESELFAERTGNLQQVSADLLLLRDKIEFAILEAASQAAKLESNIDESEGVDKKLAKRLDSLDMQLDSADGRLRDAVYMYRESYISNCLLAAGVAAGAYCTYRGVTSAAKK